MKTKGFQNVSKEGLKLGRDSKLKKLKESFKELTDWWTNDLTGEHVGSVNVSNRLDDTPCVVVVSKYSWSANMKKIMQAHSFTDPTKDAIMRGKRTLEINPRHPIIKELRERVAQDPEDESVKQTARLVYRTALMESSFAVNDPKGFASSIYKSVQKSLVISLDATVEEEEEDIETEEPEVEERESATEGADAGTEKAAEERESATNGAESDAAKEEAAEERESTTKEVETEAAEGETAIFCQR